METLKKLSIVVIVFSMAITNVKAQNSALINKAFANSYGYEYKYNYTLAVTEITNIYQEQSYEMNARLGWLYYLAKNYNSSSKYYEKAVNLKPNAIEPKLGYIKPLAALGKLGYCTQTI